MPKEQGFFASSVENLKNPPILSTVVLYFALLLAPDRQAVGVNHQSSVPSTPNNTIPVYDAVIPTQLETRSTLAPIRGKSIPKNLI